MQRCNHMNVTTIRFDVIFNFITQDVLINYLSVVCLFFVFCFHVCPVYRPL
jgi:hypothetical protein